METDALQKQKQIEMLQEQVLLLTKQVALLQQQLKSAGQEAVEYIALDEMRKKMGAAVKRLLDGDVSAEKEVEQLDKAIKFHPDYIIEEEKREECWENEQRPKCQEALKIIRRYIPPNITNIRKEELVKKGVPKEIINRMFSKKVLWFVRKHPEDIAKTHHADLKCQFTSQGLDIMEMRAVYAVLPRAFELDTDGKKAKWRTNFKQKLVEMISKEKDGRLMKNEVRHSSYTNNTDYRPLFDVTTLKATATTGCTAFEPTKTLGTDSRVYTLSQVRHSSQKHLMVQIRGRSKKKANAHKIASNHLMAQIQARTFPKQG